MRVQSIRRVLCMAGACLGLLASQAQAGYTKLFVFGDSLSESGNARAQNALTPYVPGVLDAPRPSTNVLGDLGYYSGRATNGLNYADVLAQSLGLSAEASLNGGTNYAFGGARTAYHIYNFPLFAGAQPSPAFLGMSQQVSRYLTDSSGVADPDALYVVFGGANNLQDILAGAPFARSISQTVGDLAAMLQALHGAGARHFLVPNSPDLSLVPRVRANGQTAIDAAHGLSLAFNAGLDGMLDQLDAQLGFEIDRLDTFALFTDVFKNPASYGFSDVTVPCNSAADVVFFTSLGSLCNDVGERLFWDNIHPTAEAHAILGRAALQAIPEPTTLILVAVALAAARQTARRRRV